VESNIPEILADRLNVEPVILRGLSNSELMLVLKISLGVWLPVCIITAGILGNFGMGFGAAMVLIIISVLISGTLLQKIKRGRPKFYYQHKLRFFLNDSVFKKELTNRKQVVRYTGNWSLGRDRNEPKK